jgi:small subunit ribosomal protein S3
MGQKIHPEGFRLGVRRKGEKVDFKSSWYWIGTLPSFLART